MAAYEPRRRARRERQQIRGLDISVRRWGEAGATLPDVYLHGFMDVGATFQFLVDELGGDRPIVAPDWRGFGDSGRSGPDYWFADYLADLDALLECYSPARGAVLVGHSMGGNVAAIYAGVRPERVAALVLIEGFGLRDQAPERAPERYRLWLDEVRELQPFRPYDSLDAFAGRLLASNPRLTPAQAGFLAAEMAASGADGSVTFNADPGHRRINPVLYRRAEAEACWRACRCPVLVLLGADSPLRLALGAAATPDYLRSVFADVEVQVIADTGHNLHQDASGACARAIEAFLARVGR